MSHTEDSQIFMLLCEIKLPVQCCTHNVGRSRRDTLDRAQA